MYMYSESLSKYTGVRYAVMAVHFLCHIHSSDTQELPFAESDPILYIVVYII